MTCLTLQDKHIIFKYIVHEYKLYCIRFKNWR